MNKKKILILVAILICISGIYFAITLNKDEIKTQTNGLNNVTEQSNNISDQKENTTQADGIVINKSEITSTAKFYKYKSGNVNMEVMAVKSNDGSIRTALNTCQVCYDSGRGYYKQQGSYMVCQNCGNKFSIDQIEKIKGGCNPVPILSEDKTESADKVIISSTYLDSQKSFFVNWKTN
jgi:uncharacterized membrane protein